LPSPVSESLQLKKCFKNKDEDDTQSQKKRNDSDSVDIKSDGEAKKPVNLELSEVDRLVFGGPPVQQKPPINDS